MKRILICGATGFIGRNLLDFYYQKGNYNIRAVHFNRPALEGYDGVEWVKADLRNPETVKKVLQDVDIILPSYWNLSTNHYKDLQPILKFKYTNSAVLVGCK